jgi:hypothetical protein
MGTRYSIFSAMGQKVLQGQTGGLSVIDVDMLAAGIYSFVVEIDQDHTQIYRFEKN